MEHKIRPIIRLMMVAGLNRVLYVEEAAEFATALIVYCASKK